MSLVLKYESKKIMLEGQRIKIGRAQGKNDIVISDQQVSSEHLVINNGVLLDARSTNGTFVNDAADPLPRGEEYALKEGDVITIANYKLLIEKDDGSAAAGAAGAGSAAADAAAAAAQADLVATSKTPLRAWAKHRMAARSSSTSATVRSSAFAAANALALREEAARAQASAAAASAKDDDDDGPVGGDIDDVVVKTAPADADGSGSSDPTRGAAASGSSDDADSGSAAAAVAIPAVLDDTQLESMTPDELRAAYNARATEVRVLTQKLKHKATATRVMFHRNVHSKLEDLNKPVAARLPPNEKEELESLKFQVLYGNSKKDKQIAALEQQLFDIKRGGAAPGGGIGSAAALLAANGAPPGAMSAAEAKEKEAAAVAAAVASVRSDAAAEAKAEREQSAKKLGDVQAKLKAAERAVSEAEAARDKLEHDVAELKNSSDEHLHASKSAAEQNKFLESELDRLQRELKKAGAALQNSQTEKSKAEREASQCRLSLKTAEAQRDKQQADAVQLRTQLEKANTLGSARGAGDWKAGGSSDAAATAVKTSVEALTKQVEALVAANASAQQQLTAELRPDLTAIAQRTSQTAMVVVLLFVMLGLLLLSTTTPALP